ncbi:hypothetical protein HOP50_01g00560 [Chloropicon primus]|uniref:Uncharacterized protein n=1 Tax=Chloropicon primus TaxID=1764295 RepID=A0A5B8MB11_9CHLO|nr:hypothetical protein A3770_01p00650 [Chloropicon primus]UPQ96765.1 hypothetical protein HOP50_01g00560 [Chloropicon primus]|eukprot:QDZ17547.1 hypothetical protein A3770_01p00650 [Chloropicon primus]
MEDREVAMSLVKKLLADQREDLEEIRGEVQTYQLSLARALGTAGKSLAGLKEEKSETARMLSFLKQSTEDKEKVEKDLRSGMAEKQAEITRLSGDLGKAKRVEKDWTDRLKEQEDKCSDLEKRLEQTARSETEARRRLSITEVSSSSRKEVMSLSSLVEANKVEVERLREELDLQSKSHSLRIAELQESFQAKIRELRRVHGEQIASNRSQLEDGIRAKLASEATTSAETLAQEKAALETQVGALRAELGNAKAKLSESEKNLETARTQEGDARKKTYMVEKQNRTLRAEVDDLKAKSAAADGSKKLEEENKSLAGEVGRLKAELDAKTKALEEKGAEKEGLSMLDIMEQQLVKLSNLLSAKEEEIEALKLTVERECLERGNLVAELSRARQGRKNL